VQCADSITNLGTGWDSQKSKLSPSAEILKSTPLVQFPVVNCRHFFLINCVSKTKKKAVVLLHNLCLF